MPDSSDGFRYVGPIHKTDVSRFYESTSVIIIPAPGGPMVTTGKVYEAAVQPIPIVCVQSSDGGARKALEGRPCVFSTDPEVDSIQKSMLDAAHCYKSMSEDSLTEIENFASPYQREIAISEMVKILNNELNIGNDR